MKKLYSVSVERQMIVVAESEQEAEEIALSHEQDVCDELVFARPMNGYPPGWGDDEIPFGDSDDPEREDWTIGQWIDAGAADEMRQFRARRLAKAGRLPDTSSANHSKG